MIDAARQRMELHAGRRAAPHEDDGGGATATGGGRATAHRAARACASSSSRRRPGRPSTSRRSHENDIVVGIGPAGTGKTYLAVAAAVDALTRKRVRRIVLARPAVEAGESLGFLPGDMQAKVDPYLRPLYDALEDMMPPERVQTRARDARRSRSRRSRSCAAARWATRS